jgi:hypothetical protein
MDNTPPMQPTRLEHNIETQGLPKGNLAKGQLAENVISSKCLGL